MFEKAHGLPPFEPEKKIKMDIPCPSCGKNTLYHQKGYSFISRSWLYTGWVEICEDPDRLCGHLTFMEKI